MSASAPWFVGVRAQTKTAVHADESIGFGD